MEPITAGISSLLSMFGLEGLLGSTAAAAAPGATAGASGVGMTAGTAAPSFAAQMGAGTQLVAPQATAAMGASVAPGLLSKAGDAIVASSAVQGLKTLLPKSSEEAMAAIKDKSGYGSLEKTYTTITDPKLDFRGKFDVLAPEAYKRSMENQAMFGQLQQQGQPMQMPSYARPSGPYQGGGIEEILKRQQGLLR
jgi:hypothetical protein